MANTNCLGLYIDENLIKYAKVSKERNKIKVESFGVKFYDRVEEAITQIIQETYSQKIPISINLSEEMYNYFDMFSLLTKNDLQKAIKTEFDSFCTEKGYNPNVFESRYAVVENEDEKDQVKVIYISENKIELNKIVQQVEGYKVSNISPISMAIPNLVDSEKEEDYLVVNIEDKTTVTTVLHNKVYHIDVFEEGSKEILDKINLRENSYLKAYEICKNTTIYTSQGIELQKETGNLEDIMPTLYSLVGKINAILERHNEKIKKVFITGTAALINNVDLYFQEYFANVDCEILRPYFVENVRDINMKDYIEVNSAISIALMGISEGVTGMNFKELSFSDKIPSWLKIEVNPDRDPKDNKYLGGMLTWDLGQPFDRTEQSLLRIAIGLFLLVIIYASFSVVLDRQIKLKKDEAQEAIQTTQQQISLANKDNEKIKSKTNEYQTMVADLKEANEKIAERNRMKNAIPNLLNQIMSIVPENVQLTSIENTSGTKIVITAQSNKYEQLGYLTAKIKTDSILQNAISTAGQKDNNIITIKIEGDLP